MAQLTRWQSLQITSKHRRDWYYAMARALADGKALYLLLDRLSAEYKRTSHPMAPLVRELQERVAGAGRPAKAGGSATVGYFLIGLVSANEANLIDAGEASGNLANGFQQAGDYLGSMQRLREEVVGPLKEPVFLILLLLGVLFFFSSQILPILDTMAPRSKWPSEARLFGATADHAIAISLGVIGTMVGGSIAFLRAASNWTGTFRARADKLIFPFTIVARVNSAALLTSLSGFVAAGVKFDDALTQLQSASNRYMKSIYAQLKRSNASAVKPEDALCSLQIVDHAFHWMIRLYGDSTDFAGAMRRISEQVIDGAILRTRVSFGILSLMLKVMVAGFLVWIFGSLIGIVQVVGKQATTRAQATAIQPVTALAALPRCVVEDEA